MSRGRLPRSAGIGAAACIGAALALAACSGPTIFTLSGTPTTDTSLTLSVLHTPEGNIVVTGRGDTLYDFAPDTATTSACTNDGCVFQWPPLVENGAITVGHGLNHALVGTLRRPDGSTQISYGGHPLYTYNNDFTAGMVTGQDLDQNGGLWYVLRPNGQEIHTNFSISG